MKRDRSADFFISYTRADQTFAEWIAWQLEQADYTTLIQVWDFRPGSSFVQEMDAATRRAKRTIAVLSPDYFHSGFTPSEWQAAFRRDPRGEQRILVPVRVRECDVKGLLGSIVYIDLVGCTEQEARARLLAGVRAGRAKPEAAPTFPTGSHPSTLHPAPLPVTELNQVPIPLPQWRIILGLLLICLILGGSVVAAFRIWGNPSHVTASQICQRGTPPAGAPNYTTAVAKSGIQFGFNAQHTRTNPYEHSLTPSNVRNLRLKWTHLLGSGIDSSPPVVAYGQVYVGSDSGKLYAFDAATGGPPKWVDSTGGAIYGAPAVANGIVYVGSQDGKLYAFDAATGQERGVATVEASTSSSPTLANGLIYIGSDNGKLYAFDPPIAGQSNWAWKWVAETNPNTPTGQRGIASSPAVANGLVYVSSRDGKLYAFDAATGGQAKWIASTKLYIDSSPAVANGCVYVGSQDGWLYAFDATTGQQKWRMPTGSIHDSSPAVDNNLVYVGSFANQSLYAFDASTGQAKWVASTGGTIYSSPTVANGLVYIGSFDGRFYAFDAATGGQAKWSAWATSAPGKQGIDSSPTVANGFVYIGSRDGRLYAFSLP